MFAARTLSNGDLGGKPSRAGAALYFILRIFYAFTRAVPELVWALLIVFFLSPGILPGAIALGIHNLGIVGRLAAEVVEDMDPAPSRALRSSGAGMFQVFLYAVLPQTLPHSSPICSTGGRLLSEPRWWWGLWAPGDWDRSSASVSASSTTTR